MSWKILNAYERERYNGKMMSIKSSRWYNTSWLNGLQLKPRQIDPSFLGNIWLQSIPECLRNSTFHTWSPHMLMNLLKFILIRLNLRPGPEPISTGLGSAGGTPIQAVLSQAWSDGG